MLLHYGELFLLYNMLMIVIQQEAVFVSLKEPLS